MGNVARHDHPAGQFQARFGLTVGAAHMGQRVIIPHGGHFHRLQSALRGGVPDHNRQMIRRTRGGAESADFLIQEFRSR